MNDKNAAGEDLTDRRAVARIGKQQIDQMLRLGSPGFTILSVHEDWERMGFAVVVAHPDLPVVPRDCCAPDLLPVSVNIERRVITEDDGTVGVWERSRLSVDAPEVARAASAPSTATS